MTFGLLLLSIATGPLPPVSLESIFSAEDYPTAALRRGEEGAVLVQVIVDPDGRVDTCKTLVSAHHNELDSATCRIIRTRARFKPRTDTSGKPIYSVYRQVITWGVGAPKLAKENPQLELTVNRAPDGFKLPAEFTVSYVSLKDGRISNCRSDKTVAVAPPALVSLACEVLSQSPGEIVRNNRDQPVEAMNSCIVRIRSKR
jgi:TonB family protein